MNALRKDVESRDFSLEAKKLKYASMEEQFENISLSKRVDELLKTVNAIDMEVVKPDDGIGVRVMTSDRKTKIEATEFGYKIKTKDRNIKVIPNEYVRITA